MERLDYSWMRWMCDPLRSEKVRLGFVDKTNEYMLMGEPLALTLGGQSWLFATNGSAAVFVRGVYNFREATQPQAETIRSLLIHDVKGKALSLTDLKKWAGRGWAGQIPCSDCNGKWAKTCTKCWGGGGEKGGCPRCGHEHECACPDCDNGILFCARCVGEKALTRRQGRVGPSVFDRSLIARYIQKFGTANGDEVSVEAQNPMSPLYIERPDHSWRVVVMPMRDETPSEACPRLI
jgi:hypothetical protein